MTGQPDLRRLSGDDRSALAAFRCRSFGEPWTDVIEEMVQERLADELAHGGVEAIGLWVDDELCGVIAWRFDPSVSLACRSVLLATRFGCQRRRYGSGLKGALIDEMRRAGAVTIVSEVHWDNDAIIELNAQLGATIKRIPGDLDHCLCIVPLG